MKSKIKILGIVGISILLFILFYNKILISKINTIVNPVTAMMTNSNNATKGTITGTKIQDVGDVKDLDYILPATNGDISIRNINKLGIRYNTDTHVATIESINGTPIAWMNSFVYCVEHGKRLTASETKDYKCDNKDGDVISDLKSSYIMTYRTVDKTQMRIKQLLIWDSNMKTSESDTISESDFGSEYIKREFYRLKAEAEAYYEFRSNADQSIPRINLDNAKVKSDNSNVMVGPFGFTCTGAVGAKPGYPENADNKDMNFSEVSSAKIVVKMIENGAEQERELEIGNGWCLVEGNNEINSMDDLKYRTGSRTWYIKIKNSNIKELKNVKLQVKYRNIKAKTYTFTTSDNSMQTMKLMGPVADGDEVYEINAELNIQLEQVDLALRKFITSVNDEAQSREPKVSNLDALRNKQVSTATYTHSKEPVAVAKGDIVTYKIRVYNEGETDAYAKEIKDVLPDGLELLPYEGYEKYYGNVNYGWTKDNDGKTIRTTYLKDTKLSAFENRNTLDYKDVVVVCKVKNDVQYNSQLKNIAEISKYGDKDGNEIPNDRDSTANNVDTSKYGTTSQEDDDDFEVLKLTLMDLKGRVFLDVPDKRTPKSAEPNGYYDEKDKKVSDVKYINSEGNLEGEAVDVVLYYMEDGTRRFVDGRTVTDTFEFKRLDANKKYCIYYFYNGLAFEPTAYKAKYKLKIENNKIIGVEETNASEISYASDIKSNVKSRENLISKISVVNKKNLAKVQDREEIKVTACADMDGNGNMTYYTCNDSEDRLNNINLGLIERKEFDLNLYKDVASVDLQIIDNEIDETFNEKYIYNSRKKDDMDITIRENDIQLRNADIYERKIRQSDVDAVSKGDGNIQMKIYITYKISIQNETSKSIRGKVTGIKDYYNEHYNVTKVYREINGNEQAINYANDVSTNTITINPESELYVEDGVDKKEDNIYITFEVLNINYLFDDKLKDQMLYENFAEITEYSTEYNELITDVAKYVKPNITNGELNYSEADRAKYARHKKGETAGLIDRDSSPENLDINKAKEFVNDTQNGFRSQNFKDSTNEEKRNKIRNIFEDDADIAPGLKLTVTDKPDYARTLSGNVWEDNTTLEDGIRKGNGVKDEDEKEKNIEAVKVELYKVNKDGKINEDSVADTKTDDKGNYSFTNLLPGNYVVKYTYGTKDVLEINTPKMYSGQDYKSTIFDNEKHKENTYWYTEDNKLSDATDDLDRREKVNGYSNKGITNSKAEILNGSDKETLANETYMEANTPKMKLEIEYARTTTEYIDPNDKDKVAESMNYQVNNIDFGIAERPRSELTLTKKVKHIKVTTSDGQILFDTNQKTSNLAWNEDSKIIQATIDNNLIHGSTIEITYEMIVKNTGERDYLKDGKVDKSFYDTGKESEGAELVKTKAELVVDYIANNLYLDTNKNSNWKTDGQKDEVKNIVSGEVKLDKQNIVATTESLNAELEPGQGTSTPMVLTKVMAQNSDDSDNLVYNNIAEIIKITNEVGRRSISSEAKVSIPGNLNPENEENINITIQEADSDSAEEVIVLPPFGAEQIIFYTIGATLILVVLAGGIFLIKRKVIG